MSKNSHTFWRWAGSIAEGASTACSIITSTTWSLAGKAATATIGFATDAFTYFNFQGKSIVEEHEEGEETPEPSKDNTSLTSGILQSLCIAADGASALANRYFLFYTAQKLLKHLNNGELGILLATDLLIREIFALTNEAYESCETIAEHHDEKIPFYTDLFKYCAGKKARTSISTVGSLEHAVVDDMLPLFLLYLKLTSYATLSEAVTISLGATFGTCGLALTLLLIAQTFLYEGSHTRENLAKLIGETDNLSDIQLPNWLVSSLSFTTKYLVAPLHGISTALPCFFALEEASLPAAITLSLASCYTGYKTFALSEGKEAVEHLEKMRSETQQPLLMNP